MTIHIPFRTGGTFFRLKYSAVSSIMVPMQILSARDISRYLKINEKKIYKLVQEAKIPYIKIGGKIAFAKELIDQWILEKTKREEHIYIAGSDDFLLRRIIDTFNRQNSSTAFYAPVGSMNGLKLLKNGSATMSCVHILDVDKKEYNLSYLDRYLNPDDYVVIYLFLREQGLCVRKGNPKQLRSLEDLTNKDVTFTNRNRGSGTRLLIDYLLHEKQLDPASVKGYESEAESHLDACLKVMRDEADCTVAIQQIAHLLDLDFIPLFRERFDMVISRDHFFSEQVKAFLTFFEQPALLHHVRDFTGYDTEKIGSMLHPNA
jgi:putative molybdopterin biosynthesis protein